MLDLKKLAGKQLGGAKYPEKKRINLYQNKVKKQVLFHRLLRGLLFLGFLSLFLWFGIRNPIEQVKRAELLHQRMEKQLEQLKQSNRELAWIPAEYAHYGTDYQNPAEKKLPDRLMMLDLLKETVFPFCTSVQSAVILEDRMNLQLTLPNGAVLSKLLEQIEESEAVRYVTAATESTGPIASASEHPASEQEVLVSVTIYVKTAAESGEAP